jgi:hypothetical protein
MFAISDISWDAAFKKPYQEAIENGMVVLKNMSNVCTWRIRLSFGSSDCQSTVSTRGRFSTATCGFSNIVAS